MEEVKEVPVEPAFAQGLKLNAFDHHVKVGNLEQLLGSQKKLINNKTFY